MNRVVLDLCGGTGSWSEPYRQADYDVWIVDPVVNGWTVQKLLASLDRITVPVHGILAAPPCTEFASSGARWWSTKPPWLLNGSIETARACLEVIRQLSPSWWALENPVGRIAKCVPELGQPVFKCDPCDFGDPYTKRTHLWGLFNVPRKTPVPAVEGSRIHYMPPSPDRAAKRSMTPPGFARAFFEANP